MRLNRYIALISATLLLSITTTSNAGETFHAIYQPGISPHIANTQQSVHQIKASAELGNANAQLELGYAYLSGRVVEQNNELAVNWLEKAATQGSVAAQYKLALMLEYGEGVEQNHTRAAALYQQAAALGNVGAQHALGMMFYQGKGVRVNKMNAYIWLALAADNGFRNVDLARDKVADELSQSTLVQAKQVFEQHRANLLNGQPTSTILESFAMLK